jgi:hypothetical protein
MDIDDFRSFEAAVREFRKYVTARHEQANTLFDESGAMSKHRVWIKAERNEIRGVAATFERTVEPWLEKFDQQRREQKRALRTVRTLPRNAVVVAAMLRNERRQPTDLKQGDSSEVWRRVLVRACAWFAERFDENEKLVYMSGDGRPELYDVPRDALIFRLKQIGGPLMVGADEFIAIGGEPLEIIYDRCRPNPLLAL